MKPIKKTPARNSDEYKQLVGYIIGTYRLAKKIRNARSEEKIDGYKVRGRKLLASVMEFAKPGQFPALDKAIARLRHDMRNA
jgi:hypothetical protein